MIIIILLDRSFGSIHASKSQNQPKGLPLLSSPAGLAVQEVFHAADALSPLLQLTNSSIGEKL
jgi:hypothetical protein